jgi:hypothetical protein
MRTHLSDTNGNLGGGETASPHPPERGHRCATKAMTFPKLTWPPLGLTGGDLSLAAEIGAGDEGYAAVELAPVAVVFLLILAVIIGGGRITLASMAVQDAARDAARQASIARTPQQATAAAQASAQAALASDHLDCDPVVSVNTSGFSVPVGQPAHVSATVTCNVSLAGLTEVPGMPGSRSLTATASSPLDIYRGRGP